MRVRKWLTVLAAVFALSTTAGAADQHETDSLPGPRLADDSVRISFEPPKGYEEAKVLAAKYGMERAYALPAQEGSSRSFFTVIFKKKSEEPGLRSFREYVDADMKGFKRVFPQAEIIQVNIEGLIREKFSRLGFPMEMYAFKGNKDLISVDGDSMTVFFETPSGFWSVVWTVPQLAMRMGFPVLEGFIGDMTVEKLYGPMASQQGP